MFNPSCPAAVLYSTTGLYMYTPPTDLDQKLARQLMESLENFRHMHHGCFVFVSVFMWDEELRM